MKEERWDKPAYQHITAASICRDMIEVLFADNSRITVPVLELLGGDMEPLDVTHSDYEVVVHMATGDVDIPWTTLRRLSDAGFEDHWAKIAVAEETRVGACLRKLRVARNLTGREVANRAQITPQSLSRIEHGHHDVAFQTLSRILAAMGCNLRDLADVQLAPSGQQV